MDPAAILLVVVMTLAGAAGGLGNYLSLEGSSEGKDWRYHAAPFVLGLIASFATPLFLNLASSKLTDDLLKAEGGPSSAIFVFSGFCLMAAFSSRLFLDRLTSQFLTLKSEVKSLEVKTSEVSEEQDAIKENLSEGLSTRAVESQAEATSEVFGLAAAHPPLPVMTHAVLQALVHPTFTWRSLSGIAKDVGISRETANTYIAALIRDGLADAKTAKSGHPIYRATTLGRNVALKG